MKYYLKILFIAIMSFSAMLTTCTENPANPYDISNTKIYLYARSEARAASSTGIEDSVGNIIEIGVTGNLPSNIDSVELITKDSVFAVLKGISSKDTLWASIVFTNTGTKTITGTAYISNDTTYSASITATIHPKPVNHKPDIKINGNKEITITQTCTLTVTVLDSDISQTHSYDTLRTPTGSTFSGQVFIWKPASGFIGKDTVIFMVTDNGYPAMSDTDTTVITVSDTGTTTNHPPVWQKNTIALTEKSGNTLTLTLLDKCSDVDSDKLTFILMAGAPSGDTILHDSVWSYTPETKDTGTYYPRIIAKDSAGLSDTLTLYITIVNKDTVIAPAITTQPAAQTSCPGTPVSLSIITGGTRPLTYKWYKDTVVVGTDSIYSINSLSVTDTGYYKVIVSNTSGADTSDSMKVSVTRYYVAFNSNGGSTVDTQRVICNSYTTEPTNPAKSGYKFAGWYSNSALTTAFDFTTAITANRTLYANWTQLYTVTYNGNENTGGSVPVDGTGYLNGATVTVLGNTGSLTKTHYTFSKWNTSTDGTGTPYLSGGTFAIGSANVTLYAQWIPDTFTISFNSRNSSSLTKIKVAYGSTIGTLPTDPAKASYVFNGWYTDSTNFTTQFTTSTTVTENDTVYAYWVIKDADGNIYTEVKIGTQTWIVENLRTTKYNDGTSISKVIDVTEWSNLTTSGYCYYNNTANADSIKKFGALYNWYAVNTGKLAPAGWHVPTDAEWDTLQNYLIANGYNYDGTTIDNKIAKSLAAKTDWTTTTTTGTIGNDLTTNNSSGFSALPGGYRNNSGSFIDQSRYGHWWSATESGASGAYDRYLFCGYVTLYGIDYLKSCGFSVRLLRD
jgi:uncharacterized protein (TIGR02145 family)/uncharacterized repeat protein (TIGR02543 family)